MANNSPEVHKKGTILGVLAVSALVLAGCGPEVALHVRAAELAGSARTTSETSISAESILGDRGSENQAVFVEYPQPDLMSQPILHPTEVVTATQEATSGRPDSTIIRTRMFQEGSQGTNYLVQRNDVLSEIALRFFDGDLDALLRLNPRYQENPDNIHAGDPIRLPEGLIVGEISLWDKQPIRNNQWNIPGEADPQIEWKDIVIHRWIANEPNPQLGSARYPFVVVTIFRNSQ